MTIATQALAYGWAALASLGPLTNQTIYTASNHRWQVKAEDVRELVLGVQERCLATYQAPYGYPYVGSLSYGVRPIEYVATMVNSNGASVTVTNVIGWHVDRAMVTNLDATIKALVPYYLDTNTVYEGSTLFASMTVTGLWASLRIGDGTNQFTRSPRIPTNETTVITNWIISYTNYWPATNGTSVPVLYTADVQQVVNYAESWTEADGATWVTRSNWQEIVITKTNTATYGDLPWQIYREDLEERYKVLQAMQQRRLLEWTSDGTVYGGQDSTQFSHAVWSVTTTPPEATQMALHPTAYNTSPVDVYLSPHARTDYGHVSVTTPYWMIVNAYGVVAGLANETAHAALFCSPADGSYATEITFTETNCVSLYYVFDNPALPFSDFTYTRNRITVNSAGSVFFCPVITFPFQYCTNKYW